MYWKIHPRGPRDFPRGFRTPRPKRLPEGKAQGQSQEPSIVNVFRARIFALGSVSRNTVPRADIRNTSSRGKHWPERLPSGNLSGLGVQNPRPWEISWASGVYFPIHPSSRQYTDSICLSISWYEKIIELLKAILCVILAPFKIQPRLKIEKKKISTMCYSWKLNTYIYM